MTGSITLKEVLSIIDSGAHFSIAFVTCDKNRKTGGEWIEIASAAKHLYISRSEQARLDKAQPLADIVSKDPSHYENSTRNLMLPNGEIRKMHIRLIRKFNGKTVL